MDYLLILFSIFFVNILLSGDNALVIALASRNLPKRQKKQAILLGSVGAVGLRVVLSFVAVFLLTIPYLQLVGGLLLLWIAAKLISDDPGENDEKIEAKTNLWGAIKTIIVADLIMSLDNVIAIAGVAKGNVLLIVIGLGISVPLIIWGSSLISLLMHKWPIIITLGAALLGWTAGDMILADKEVSALALNLSLLSLIFPGVCALVVVIIGNFISRKEKRRKKDSQ